MLKYIFISGFKSEKNTFFKLKSKVTGKNKLSISIVFKFDISYSAGTYIDRDSNQFPHYRPWVIFQSIGLRF